MKIRYLLTASLLILIVAGIWPGGIFSGDPLYQEHARVKSGLDANFEYQTDLAKWGINHKVEQWNGDSPIKADCEEYAAGAIAQLSRRGILAFPRVVRTRRGELHMIACSKLWCMDNLQADPYPVAAIRNLYPSH